MPETQRPPAAAIAAALALAPSEAEKKLGYKTPAQMIFDIAGRGDAWGVVAIDGRKFRLSKSAAAKSARESPARKGGKEPSREAALLAAIAGLEEGNSDHWTKSGKPEVRALEAAAGFKDISAAERDAAWAAHRERRGRD